MSINSTIIAPPALGNRKRLGWWVLPALAAVALGAAAFTWNPFKGKADVVVAGQFYTVVPMDLEVKVVKDGELQAVSYTDIKSDVETTTQILTLIPEGTIAKKGDVLIKLDASALTLRRESLELDLKKAESNLKISREMRDIQESQNGTNKEAAEVGLQLARLDVQQYLQGTYPQSLENANTALDMAALSLTNKQEDLDSTKKLFDKGFVTAADVKKSELDVRMAKNEVEKAKTALKVLKEYANAMDTARLKSAEAQAEQKLIRTIKENASNLNTKQADVDEKEHSLALLQKQMQKLNDQIDACTIKAPEDGLVIYSSSIERNQREPVQEGTSVRQSQWLLRLPDVRTMKAVLKIQEAQKPKLDETKMQRAMVWILGVPRPVGATLTKVSVLPDNSQRWYNP